MPSMWEHISANKTKSYLFLVAFIFFVTAIGYVSGEIFGQGFGIGGITIAFIISIIMTVGSFFFSHKVVLAVTGARPATQKEFPYLYNTVEGLSIAAGIPKPKLYVIDSDAANAFATGRDPEHGIICATTGLLKKLNRSELEGVIAHEMSHIGNYDIRFMMLVAVLAGIIIIFSRMIIDSFRYGSGGRRGGGAILLVIALVLAILAPIFAELIKLAISRRREFLADATGAKLTRYPEGLASALEKLAADKAPLHSANEAVSHLFIVNPFKGKDFVTNMLSTHPPMEERIKILRGM